VATVVFFHAHPDDEALATAGTMIKMSAAGHRVLLVLATRSGFAWGSPCGFFGLPRQRHDWVVQQ
jgi:hypothetical protein